MDITCRAIAWGEKIVWCAKRKHNRCDMRLRKAIKTVREIITVAVECIKLQIYKYKKHSTNAFLARKKRDFRSM